MPETTQLEEGTRHRYRDLQFLMSSRVEMWWQIAQSERRLGEMERSGRVLPLLISLPSGWAALLLSMAICLFFFYTCYPAMVYPISILWYIIFAFPPHPSEYICVCVCTTEDTHRVFKPEIAKLFLWEATTNIAKLQTEMVPPQSVVWSNLGMVPSARVTPAQTLAVVERVHVVGGP